MKLGLCSLVASSVALVLTLASAAETQAQAPQTGVLQACALKRDFKKTVGLNYLVYLPKDYGKQGVKWPLVVWLCGAGVGGDTVKDLPKIPAFDRGPPMLVEQGKEFPFVMVAPQCSQKTKGFDEDNIRGLIDEILEKYAVDSDRVCVSGMSMGAFFTWRFSQIYPEYLSCAVPIAGGGDLKLAKRIVNLPIWIFHGDKDVAVGIGGDKQMVKALQDLGSTVVKFTEYPDADHPGTRDRAIATPELYDWILNQKRVASPEAAAVTPKVDTTNRTPPTPVQQFNHYQGYTFQRPILKSSEAKYLLSLPKGWNQNAKWPVILYLHGGSGIGNDLEKVKADPGLTKLMDRVKELPFVVVAPQCPNSDGWDPDVLRGLVDVAIEKYGADPDRVCVTGLSWGSTLWYHVGDAWGFVQTWPDCIASAVPIGCVGDSTYGDGSYYGQVLAYLPIWVFHGAKDKKVSIFNDEKAVIALKQFGSKNVRFTIYPDAGHDIWDQAYDTPGLFDWILNQRRVAAPAELPVKVTPKGNPVTLVATSMKLTKAEGTPLSGASDGKVVKFDGDDSTAVGRVNLPEGAYEIEGWMLRPDKEHGFFCLEVEGNVMKQFCYALGKLTQTIPWERMRIYIDAPRDVEIKVTHVQNGVLVDRLVIRPLY